MKALGTVVFGALFGLGLAISGMLDPAKVIGFLDVTGAWNPQLAFVMAGAIAVAAPAFLVARRRRRTLFGDPISLRDGRPDARLVAGAAVFGLGWGLSGICPGPGIVLLGFAGAPAWIFFAGLACGLLVARAPAFSGVLKGRTDGPVQPATSGNAISH